MTPSHVTDHVQGGLAQLTSMFQGNPVTGGLLASYLKQVQKLEDAIWTVLLGRNLVDCTAAQLTALGTLLGEPRNGRDDTTLRAALQIRILINRSTGKAKEIIQILSLVAAGADWAYLDAFPAGFVALFGGPLAGFLALEAAAGEVHSGGVEAEAWWAPAGFATSLVPSSLVGTATNQRGPSWTDGLPLASMVHVSRVSE